MASLHKWCLGCWREGIPPLPAVFLGLITVQVGFGLYPVVVKSFALNAEANPLIFSFYRDLICAPVLFICAAVGERQFFLPKIKELVIFCLLGLLGTFGNQLLYIIGVDLSGANSASIFQNAIPVWGALISMILCIEKFKIKQWYPYVKLVGIAAAAGGAVEMILTKPKVAATPVNTTNSDGNSSKNVLPLSLETLGYLSLVGNTFLMALTIILQKKLIFGNKKSRWKDLPIFVTAYTYVFGTMFMGLSSVYYYSQPSVFVLPQEAWIGLVYAVFVTSSLCYLLLSWANLHISSSIVTAFWPLQVPITLVSSFLINHEELAGLQYIGGCMIVLGLLLVVLAGHKEHHKKKEEKEYSNKREKEESFKEKKPLLDTNNVPHSNPSVQVNK